jgi:hypothetical protein
VITVTAENNGEVEAGAFWIDGGLMVGLSASTELTDVDGAVRALPVAVEAVEAALN